MIIYKTTNLLNKKIYIGKRYSAKDKFLKDNYFGSGLLLKKAINKYGIENFKNLICEDKDINYYEKELIRLYKSQDKSIGGDGGKTMSNKRYSLITSGENNPMFGKKHKEESKIKMGHDFSGKKNPMYGKNHSIDTIKKIKNTLKNIWTEEKKDKQSDIIKKSMD